MKIYFSVALLACICLSSCLKDTGKVTMTYTKATARYGDLNEVRNTPLIESSRAITDPGKIFIGDDYLLIGEEGKGIHVFDNTSPTNPVNVLFLNVPFCKEFFVKDHMVYAESQYDLLKIDMTNFQSPFVLGRVTDAFAEPLLNDDGEYLLGFDFNVVTEDFDINGTEHEELSLNDHLYYDYTSSLIPPSSVPSSFAGASSGVMGTVNRITEHNGYIYAVSNSKIFVFTNSAAFSKVNEVQTWSNLETIFPQDDHLFLGTRNSMDIYSISNPETPEQTSSYWHTTSCDPVLPYGDVAYVTLRTGDFAACPGDVNALMVLDIEDIYTPTERQEIEMTSPYGMAIHDGILYVGNGEAGLEIFNATTPTYLQHLSTDNSVKAYDVIPHPTIPHLILTSGPNGIEQYEYDADTYNLSLVSQIQI